ncbi:hypothetical protein J8M20_02140 [Pseudoalteromonas luteoviolacea]|uniref:hypothetical protein n=1 Tax=Pseudoalteromonas luteoviolacea TaxID=43657 RepID=UPI001B3801C6|nr:hypothetical protein [Pseudoalteromonas luteoviolacea]MBQ4810112.1 hypothetical protein [Pseudoalteromonas luteoviolacea]
MKKLSLSIVVTLLSACAQNEYKVDVLERGFGELEYGGITFLDGPWFAPGSNYGYHISNNELRIAHSTESGEVEVHIIQVSSCSELEEGIKELKKAAFESSKIALGVSKVAEGLPEVIVMDGPSYKLTIHSDEMWGSITLEGGGTTSYIVPWVNAAFKIGEIAENCEDTANKSKQQGPLGGTH